MKHYSHRSSSTRTIKWYAPVLTLVLSATFSEARSESARAASPRLTPVQAAPSAPANWTYRIIGDAGYGSPAGWTSNEVMEYGFFLNNVSPCSSFRLHGNGLNQLGEQDFLAKLRLEPHYLQMLGQFAVVSSSATEAPPSKLPPTIPVALKCLVILKQHFPELQKVRFYYFTYKSGRLVDKTGSLTDLLLDGSFDQTGRHVLSPSFAPEDLLVLADSDRTTPQKSASPPLAPARAVPAPPGKPLLGLNRRAAALTKSFSIGAYEAVAIKSDGSIEVRNFDSINSFTPYDAKVGAGHVQPGLSNIAGVRAQATFDTIRIGTVSVARDTAGRWIGWRPGAPPVPISFSNHLGVLGMTNLDAPPAERIVNIAGGRTSIWSLYDDGTVLMSSERGVLPGTFMAKWQKEHKFAGVSKVIATPGPSGSLRALFLRDDGTVWANGVNFFQGWLQSEGSTLEKKMSPAADPNLSPLHIESLNHVRDVAAYWPSTAQGKVVALLDNGAVVWFVIDRDATDDSLRHLAVNRIPHLPNARSVAAGAWGLGAVDADGKVWVWGSNPEVLDKDMTHAVRGFRGGATPGMNEDDPTMVPGLSDVVDIDFSFAFAGALRSDRTVWVWNHESPVKIFDDVRAAP